MVPPGFPPNELGRLEALRRYYVLDTPPEAAFDRLTSFAAHLLAAPFSYVSLVDQARQWFKSAYGLSVRETPRETSFCGHAILGDEVMVVLDASQDARLHDNPLVIGSPGIRFYAGAQLKTPDGYNIGTMCVADTEPRARFPEEHSSWLAALAATVMDELELRLAAISAARLLADSSAIARENADMLRRRQEAEEALRLRAEHERLTIENSPLGLAAARPDGRFTKANPAYCALLGYSEAELLEMTFTSVTHPEDVELSWRHVRDLLAGSVRTCEYEKRYLRKDGSVVSVIMRVGLVRDAAGQPQFIVAIVEDITERKKAEEQIRNINRSLRRLSGELLRAQDEERRRIARELHDCTAQNLAVLAMNLTLLGNLEALSREPRAREVLSQSEALADQALREIRSVSYLLHPPALDDLGLVPALRSYVDGFSERTGIRTSLDLPPQLGRLPQLVETTLFRIVQEGLANIHRHSGSPTASIRIRRTRQQTTLEISDQGRGFPPEVLTEGGPEPTRLGVGILGMRERAEQLGGCLEMHSTNRGATLLVTLPTKARRAAASERDRS